MTHAESFKGGTQAGARPTQAPQLTEPVADPLEFPGTRTGQQLGHPSHRRFACDEGTDGRVVADMLCRIRELVPGIVGSERDKLAGIELIVLLCRLEHLVVW